MKSDLGIPEIFQRDQNTEVSAVVGRWVNGSGESSDIAAISVAAMPSSSGTFMRALQPKPSPAALLLLPAGASEVSRFSCMKLPGVSGVYNYAGPSRGLRCRPCSCCLPPSQKRRHHDCIFSKLNTQPTCTPVYASLPTSRCATQNSGPSGSLLPSRRTLAFPASCRFIPAH